MNLHNRWSHRVAHCAPSPGSRGIQPGGPAPSPGINHVVERSPIEDAAFPENVAYGSDGSTRIDLGCNWPAMLAGLRKLGELLVITRNEWAVIAKTMPYPAWHGIREGEITEKTGETFDPDFSAWASAFARHERTENGHVFKVEFLDVRKKAFHSVVLTPGSRVDVFADWVRAHQKPVAGRRCPARAGAAPQAEPVDLAGDLQIKRTKLLPLFEMLVQKKLAIRAIVGHDALVQGHSFQPKSVRQTGSRIFCSSDTTALHFEVCGVARLTLQNIEFDDRPCWTLRAQHADGRLLFLIAPSAQPCLTEWNKLLLSFTT